MVWATVFLRSLDGEDLANDVPVRAFRVPTSQSTNVSGWLHRITGNPGRDRVRYQRRISSGYRGRALAMLTRAQASA